MKNCGGQYDFKGVSGLSSLSQFEITIYYITVDRSSGLTASEVLSSNANLFRRGINHIPSSSGFFIRMCMWLCDFFRSRNGTKEIGKKMDEEPEKQTSIN